MKNKGKVIKAIILAGGYSKRMGQELPKQLAKIGNKPILSFTLDVFQQCPAVDSIILVVNRIYLQRFRKLIREYGYNKIAQLCLGGRTRQQSVFNALSKIRDCDYVIIHDAVRPLVTKEAVLRVIEAVKRFAAVSCAVKAVDTIAKEKNGFIGRTLVRDKLWHIQTPQAFRFNLIWQAHKAARAKKIFAASDDAQLLLRLKKKVKLVEGSYKNIKITTPLDLDIFAHLVRNKE